MFVFKIKLLVLTVLVSFNLEVDSVSSVSLKEANNTKVSSENPESAELEYRMLHNKKGRKVLAKLLQKFLEKLDYDTDESNEKQTVFDVSKAGTIASILTTEVMNTKANIIDSTTSIPLTTEQSTKVSNSTFEVTNSDQSHVTEPINIKFVSDSKTTKHPDDVINPIQNNDDNNYTPKTSVTVENKEENNNSSTTIVSSEIPITTPTELTMLSNNFTNDNDNNSTTQSLVTTQTSGLINSEDQENVDRPSLENLDNISTPRGPDYKLTEKPEILNFTEGINANNESSTTNPEFNKSETTQNIGLSDTSLENVTTSSPIPNLQENTNELKNVMPKISNLTESNVITNDTAFTLQESDKPSTSRKEISADNANSSKPLNTTETSEIPKESIEFKDTNTSKIPDNNNNIIEVTNSNNATNGIQFSSRESEGQKEPNNATSADPIIVTTITPENPNILKDTSVTMMPVGNSTEDINSTPTNSNELATTQPTSLSENPIPNKLDNNDTRTTEVTTNTSTETTKNIESVTTDLPITGSTNSPISENPDIKTSCITDEPVFAYKINNSNSEPANDTTKISIAENPKEDYNTSVPPKDTNLNSSLAVEPNNSSILKLTDSTSELPNNADNKPDKLKSENIVKETKSQEHIDQQNNQKVCDDSTSRPNKTADIINLNSATEESNQLKDNTLIIISLQNSIIKPMIPKNSLQRLFMRMMISNS